MLILQRALSSVVKTKNLFASILFRNNCIMDVTDKSVYLNWTFNFKRRFCDFYKILFLKTCPMTAIKIVIDSLSCYLLCSMVLHRLLTHISERIINFITTSKITSQLFNFLCVTKVTKCAHYHFEAFEFLSCTIMFKVYFGLYYLVRCYDQSC